MAWRIHFPLLLLLLLPGSWVLSDRQILQRVVGETLSVTCNYPSPGETYKEKSLCREVAGFVCAKLAPSPMAQGRAPRLSIWDEPQAGLFIVSLAELREKDSGHYWCSMRHTSSNTVFNSDKFYLAVSPAPTQPSKAACKPTSSKTWSSVSPTGRSTETPWAPSAFTTPAWPQNATLCPGPAVPCALVPGFCGLLVAKSLALLALLW
ncbi:natural cytotoxicity triggering receptor 2 isoform X2 [Fukomys damarensis]|nr:natural cytotoxicity triggering receptor 2 isoform X2 [Fukomys damarensis]